MKLLLLNNKEIVVYNKITNCLFSEHIFHSNIINMMLNHKSKYKLKFNNYKDFKIYFDCCYSRLISNDVLNMKLDFIEEEELKNILLMKDII